MERRSDGGAAVEPAVMLILIIFAFLAGVVTILSPCILPILPIVLATSASDPTSRHKPLGIVTGFVASFTFFTLFLASLVKLTGISADSLRTLSVVVIAAMGVSLILPAMQKWVEVGFAWLANLAPNNSERRGFGGGVIVGLSLGLLWTPCVGPILASVISLAISGTVTWSAAIITFAYAAGTAIPMLLIIRMGNRLLTQVPWLLKNTGNIQRMFGVLMLITAIGIQLGWDRSFQSYILDKFPNYGVNLTKLEDNKIVDEQLQAKPREKTNLSAKGYPASELIVGGEWINSEPLTLKELRGKVILIDFWTYTCINCQRTLPYLKEWDRKYREAGLVIIGVHAPEFEFEKSLTNVKKAAEDFGLTYPIMQDNDFATWRAYDNRYWPAKYLIDKEGNVRYSHFGEGKYDETEAMIQELLAVTAEIDNPAYSNFARSPETYLGYARMSNLQSPERVIKDKVNTYSHAKLDTSEWSLAGEWKVAEEYSEAGVNASLDYRFNAKNVYLVLKNMETEGSVKVYLDGELTKTVEVQADALYPIVELDAPGTHTLKLEFDPGIQAYAFTFG